MKRSSRRRRATWDWTSTRPGPGLGGITTWPYACWLEPFSDGVTAIAGDLIRFQGVSFSIEDTKALEIEARAAAAADLMAKAQQIADLTRVALGKPVFIAEVSRSSPKPLAMADRAFVGAPAAAVETPILTGELDVVITLQALFPIQ